MQRDLEYWPYLNGTDVRPYHMVYELGEPTVSV